MKKIKSLLLSVLSLMSLVGVAQPCTVLADETQSTDINIETQAANIDITIPSTLEWTFNADGTNTLPDNWSITNNSAVDVMLDTVTINGENGWSLVNEQPTVDNTKAVLLTIDNVSQSNGVYTLSTELAKNGGTHKLSYDVKRANFTSNGIVNSQKAYTATLDFSYSKENFTVTFDANEGTLSSNTRSIEDGSTIGTLPTPTRNYNVFLGWYTQAEGGEQITKDTVVTENLTVYAHWNEILYGYKDAISYKEEYVYSTPTYYKEEVISGSESKYFSNRTGNYRIAYTNFLTINPKDVDSYQFDVIITVDNIRKIEGLDELFGYKGDWSNRVSLGDNLGYFSLDENTSSEDYGKYVRKTALNNMGRDFLGFYFLTSDEEYYNVPVDIRITAWYKDVSVYHQVKTWSEVVLTEFDSLPERTNSRALVYSKDNGLTWNDCNNSCPIK